MATHDSYGAHQHNRWPAPTYDEQGGQFADPPFDDELEDCCDQSDRCCRRADSCCRYDDYCDSCYYGSDELDDYPDCRA